MRINVTIDSRHLKARTSREVKRLAYSTSQAINETAKAVQLAERANLDRKFQIRKASFMYRLVKITAWASPRRARAYAEVKIDDTKQRVILGQFEEGQDKVSEFGKHVAVPLTGSKARPSFAQNVPTSMSFRSLDFQRHVTAGGKVQWKGKRRTFLIPEVGVFQRGGGLKNRGRSRKRFKGLRAATKVTMLYSFKKKAPIEAKLEFHNVAVATFDREFDRQFMRAFNRKKGE